MGGMEQQPLTLDEREAALIAALPRYIANGYQVDVQTMTTAQLLRPRGVDVGAALMSFLLCGFGLLIYLGVHFSKPHDAVYLTVDEWGRLHEHVGKR